MLGLPAQEVLYGVAVRSQEWPEAQFQLFLQEDNFHNDFHQHTSSL